MLSFLQHQVSTSLWCLHVCSEQFECPQKHSLLLWISFGRVRTMPLRPAKADIAEVPQYSLTGLTLQSDMSPETDRDGWKRTRTRFKKQTEVEFASGWNKIPRHDYELLAKTSPSCLERVTVTSNVLTTWMPNMWPQQKTDYQSTVSSKQATSMSTWLSLSAGNPSLISLKSGRKKIKINMRTKTVFCLRGEKNRTVNYCNLSTVRKRAGTGWDLCHKKLNLIFFF